MLHLRLGLDIFRRPLCAGLCWWLVTGDQVALPLGVFFELFWLDLFYVGTYVPPQALLPYLVLLALNRIFALQEVAVLVFPLLLSLPLAQFGASLQAYQRTLQNRGYNKLMAAVEGQGRVARVASLAVNFSSLQQAVLNGGFFLLSGFAFALLLQTWLWHFEALPLARWSSWPLLWCLSAVGGVLALRIPWAFAAFVAAAGVFGALMA